MTSLFYEIVFFLNFMVLNPDKSSLMLFSIKDELQTNLTSLTTLLLKIAKKKTYWESLLITNLTSPCILLALPKRQI